MSKAKGKAKASATARTATTKNNSMKLILTREKNIRPMLEFNLLNVVIFNLESQFAFKDRTCHPLLLYPSMQVASRSKRIPEKYIKQIFQKQEGISRYTSHQTVTRNAEICRPFYE